MIMKYDDDGQVVPYFSGPVAGNGAPQSGWDLFKQQCERQGGYAVLMPPFGIPQCIGRELFQPIGTYREKIEVVACDSWFEKKALTGQCNIDYVKLTMVLLGGFAGMVVLSKVM